MHNNAIKFWSLDQTKGKLMVLDCQLAQHKRFINCVTIDSNDFYAYCGTRTGDILEIAIETASYHRTGPVKRIFKGGIHQINCEFGPSLVVSTASGSVARISKKTMLFEEEVNLQGGPVVSLTNSREKIYALTASGTLHSIGGDDSLSSAVCFMTTQTDPVTSIKFPAGFGEIFAVQSKDEIRLWNVADQKELLRIALQEHEGQSPLCNCLEFMADGKSIVTGWTDGKIRAFTPQSGRLLYIIREGHRVTMNSAASQISGVAMAQRYSNLVPTGVTSLSTSIDCGFMLTGGFDGEVKLWQIGRQTQTLIVS